MSEIDTLSLIIDHYVKLTQEQEKLGAPMFWIGIYVASVSFICSLSMAIDGFTGFRHRKLWFPCKFFTLNATSLTLLGIAMKLPLDLSGYMPNKWDQLAKLCSIVFMCVTIGNFMPSLGPMDNKELLTNITALGILVITVAVNVFIQLYTGAIWAFKIEHTVVTSLMLLLFVILCFSALMIPISKQVVERKYREKHKMEEAQKTDEFSTVEKLKVNVKKYWMMAESGGPQFVMASSATCSASGAICFLTFLILVEAWIQQIFLVDFEGDAEPMTYRGTTSWILWTQSVGLVIGTIGPAFRWFTAISFKSSKKGIKAYCQNVFQVENYWIQMLVQWRERIFGLRIRSQVCKKIVHNTKNLILDICTRVQIVIVVASKTVRLLPIFLISIGLSCYSGCKPLKRKLFPKPTTSGNQGGSESGISAEVDFSRYVLQLEGDEELPKRILNNISNSANHLIQVAGKKQPKNLMELLEKFAGLKGASEFENGHVPHLHSSDKPNCWSLSLVTMTSIAIALPNIENDNVDQLLSSVGEGYLYIRHVEKSLDAKGDLVNMRNAADVVWLGVEIYSKWLDDDLGKMALMGKTFGEILQTLSDVAKKREAEFKRQMSEDLEENRLKWPVKVIAANSMYEICQTILQEYQGGEEETYEKLFKQLSVIITDILCDCLTNLPHVIYMKCYCTAIEKREESVRQAARLLGETQEIMKILQQHQLIPSLHLDPAAASV
ncbi:hypothetical protein LguiB_028700 [Lonicera macranthoides]